jgi:hypothetical protein
MTVLPCPSDKTLLLLSVINLVNILCGPYAFKFVAQSGGSWLSLALFVLFAEWSFSCACIAMWNYVKVYKWWWHRSPGEPYPG